MFLQGNAGYVDGVARHDELNNSMIGIFSNVKLKPKKNGLFQPGLFQDAINGPDWEILLWVRNRNKARPVKMFEMVMAPSHSNFLPSIFHQHPNQLS